MDDLIVIILTLLIAAVGAISQIKKKQRPDLVEENEDPDSGSSNFWDEMIRENQELAPQERVDFINPENEMRPYFKITEPKMAIAEENNITFKEEKSPEKNRVDTTETEPEKGFRNFSEGFSLREAIIFSEIIQRKYF